MPTHSPAAGIRISRYWVVSTLLLLALLVGAPAADAAEHTYEPTQSEVLNPERGLYEAINLVEETELGWVRDQGFTLAFAYIRLDDYHDSAVPQSFLDDVVRGLDAARDAGIKIIFRVSYNFGIGEDDASMEQVHEHIGQFTSIWESHQDVIVVVQAGFIGAWGEWHSSTNGLDTPAAKAEIREALLDAVPNTRMVQFRYLPDIEAWLPAPLTAATAYDRSDISRTAHHNDCFLATDTDAGTYWPGEIDDHKIYLEAASEFMVVGGETCQVGFDDNQARRSCAVATDELARFHWSYLNEGFHQPTLQIWKDEGCWDEITNSLGYRYQLTTASLPDQVVAGASLTGSMTIRNEGYATAHNPRPAYLVLDGPTRVDIEIDTDPRLWTAGESTLVPLDAAMPNSLPDGEYTLALWLPDAASSLHNRADYAIQLANEDVWNANSGYNVLGKVTVLPSATCTGDIGSRFVDVGATNTFCGDIEWLADTGITRGCNPPANDLFCPEATVTRGQMAAFLHRALDLPGASLDTFVDDDGTAFEPSIEAIAEVGITKGCNPPVNDRYCPDASVTRDQMAAFLVRALDLPAASTDTFGDDDGSVFEANIDSLATADITRGCNPPVNDRYCPNATVTREQMAAFLRRALNP